MSNYKLENMLCSFCNEEHTSVFFLDIRAWFSYCHKVEKVTFTSFSMKETFGLTPKIFNEAFVNTLKNIQNPAQAITVREYLEKFGSFP